MVKVLDWRIDDAFSEEISLFNKVQIFTLRFATRGLEFENTEQPFYL